MQRVSGSANGSGARTGESVVRDRPWTDVIGPHAPVEAPGSPRPTSLRLVRSNRPEGSWAVDTSWYHLGFGIMPWLNLGTGVVGIELHLLHFHLDAWWGYTWDTAVVVEE